ncbi:DUF421 domain-containing protein [Peribacillus acanthi]|uniref:DUF421 domain-containing protein n=1 Tax=Peribacillus acanthi TaxID=2171554 RepID=UPI000D3EABFF
MYVLIIIIFRLMGKREIGELNILDLVVFIMIAELAVISIEQPNSPIVHSIFPMIMLMLIQITSAILSLKSQRFREFVDGRPTMIITNGKIDEKAMKKQRYNFEDLLVQLREKDVQDVKEVEYAILETSGKLSVFKKEEQNQKKTKTKTSSLALPLILDGAIQQRNLIEFDKTQEWLLEQMKKQGYPDITQISYCSYDNEAFFIDQKDESSSN